MSEQAGQGQAQGQAQGQGQGQAGVAQGQGAPPQFLADDKGNLRENWFEALGSEDLKAAPALKNFKTVEGLAKSFLHAQRMVGSDKLPLLTENSTAEEKAEFYNKLGRPEKPDGYKFAMPKPEDLPKGLTISEEAIKAFSNVAHEVGLTQEQAAKLVDWHSQLTLGSFKDADTEIEQQHSASVAQLQKEWGRGYQARVDLANRVVRSFDPQNKLVDLGLANNVELVKMFAAIGEKMSEDKLLVADARQTPDNVKGEINKIMGDPKNPYFLKDHPQHHDMVKKVADLYASMQPPQE